MFILVILWRVAVPIFAQVADPLLNWAQAAGVQNLPGLPLATYVSWLSTDIQYGVLLAAFALVVYALVHSWLEEPDTYYEEGGGE